MYKYEFELQSLIFKRDIIHWVEEWLIPKEIDECLTEKKISFTTDIQLTLHEKTHALKVLPSLERILEDEI